MYIVDMTTLNGEPGQVTQIRPLKSGHQHQVIPSSRNDKLIGGFRQDPGRTFSAHHANVCWMALRFQLCATAMHFRLQDFHRDRAAGNMLKPVLGY